MFDHESHELCGVATNTEEFKPILFDEFLESGMGCNSNSVAVCIFEDLSQRNKGLNITSRTNDLDNDIELRGRNLARLATEARWDVGGRKYGEIGIGRHLALEGRAQQVGQSPVLGVDVDVNATITYTTIVSCAPHRQMRRGGTCLLLLHRPRIQAVRIGHGRGGLHRVEARYLPH